jgi:hypothetical protein
MMSFLMATLLAAPQGLDQPKKMGVERPLLERMSQPVSEKVDLAKSGIDWKRGLQAALNESKPVLLFQLLGNLDDVHC